MTTNNLIQSVEFFVVKYNLIKQLLMSEKIFTYIMNYKHKTSLPLKSGYPNLKAQECVFISFCDILRKQMINQFVKKILVKIFFRILKEKFK